MKEETAEDVHLQFCLATHPAANITFFQMDQTTLLTLQAEYPLEQSQLGLLTVLSLENRTERTLLRKKRISDILSAPNKIILKIFFILDATQ